ncbi:MAG: hypothetical protein Q9220_001884 [cf. Caloplaca sp. 1 TL-2023]
MSEFEQSLFLSNEDLASFPNLESFDVSTANLDTLPDFNDPSFWDVQAPASSIGSIQQQDPLLQDATGGMQWDPMLNPADSCIDPFLLSISNPLPDSFNATLPTQPFEYPNPENFNYFSSTTPLPSTPMPFTSTSLPLPPRQKTVHSRAKRTLRPKPAAPLSTTTATTANTVKKPHNPQLAQKWNTKSTQPRISGGDCPCKICKGELDLRVSPAQLDAWEQERKGKFLKTAYETAITRGLKRKVVAVYASEGEEESEFGSEESEYKPRGRAANVTSAPKRRAVARATTRKRMPKGLEIDMNRW